MKFNIESAKKIKGTVRVSPKNEREAALNLWVTIRDNIVCQYVKDLSIIRNSMIHSGTEVVGRGKNSASSESIYRRKITSVFYINFPISGGTFRRPASRCYWQFQRDFNSILTWFYSESDTTNRLLMEAPHAQPNMIQQPVHAEIGPPVPHANPMSSCDHIAIGILKNEHCLNLNSFKVPAPTTLEGSLFQKLQTRCLENSFYIYCLFSLKIGNW